MIDSLKEAFDSSESVEDFSDIAALILSYLTGKDEINTTHAKMLAIKSKPQAKEEEKKEIELDFKNIMKQK